MGESVRMAQVVKQREAEYSYTDIILFKLVVLNFTKYVSINMCFLPSTHFCKISASAQSNHI